MARIKTYVIDGLLSDNDKVIGTDVDSLNQTKNYKLSDLRNYFVAGLSPEVGGTLRISEITYEGELDTPEDVANSLDPSFQVLPYHLVFINVNGQQFLLKEQDILIGEDELALSNSDFIEFPISVGPTGPAGPTGPTGPAGPQGEDGVSVVNDGISIDVTGSGTIEDQYTPNILNLQKVVT